jgi:minor histocompatibility antigen H13
LISPTSFNIATLLLVALFFYDIFFVFCTPMMVTVATTLDVPIKLLFPRPGATVGGAPALAMLGLGDVVVPGIVVAMALRWDLWRFYEQKRVSNLSRAEKEQSSVVDSDGHDLKRRKLDLAQKTKSPYIKVTGNWGERFWTNDGNKAAFSKTYFYASLVGYVLGMLATLVVMHVWKHAQPALLYLVPGVLGSIWGTALVRGEVRLMCSYSEDEEQMDTESTDTASTAIKKGDEDQEESPAGNDDELDKSGGDSGGDSGDPEASTEDEEWFSITVTKRSLQPWKPITPTVVKEEEQPSLMVEEEEESETFSSTSSISSLGSSLADE